MAFALEFIAHPGAGGPLSFARVSWDSECFGFDVYEIRCEREAGGVARHLPALLARLAAGGRYLAVTRVPFGRAELVRALTGQGFYPIETSFGISRSLARPLPSRGRAFEGLLLRAAGADELPRLEELARTAFRTDRFHLDPAVPDDKADERYARWIRRAFADGDPVFVYEDSGHDRMLGFFHVRGASDGSGVVDLSLAATDPGVQGSGVGVLLYEAVLEQCRALGFRSAQTRITAQNTDVLNLFVHLGFSFDPPVLCLHRVG